MRLDGATGTGNRPRATAWRATTLAVVLAAVVATGDLAYTTRAVPTYGAQPEGDPVLLSNADGQNAYTGVVRYLGRATCTGVFLATIPDGEDPGDAPAYVATNGHCPDFPGSNDVLLDRPAPARHARSITPASRRTNAIRSAWSRCRTPRRTCASTGASTKADASTLPAAGARSTMAGRSEPHQARSAR